MSPRARFAASTAVSLTTLCCVLLACGGCAQERPIYYRIDAKYNVHDPQFAHTINNLLGPPLVNGNEIQTLSNGEQIFPAMLQSIHSARKTITFETYIYWKGTIGKEFTAALAERARAGVKVHVLFDWFGSAQIDPNYVAKLRAAGAQVQDYHAFHWYDLDTWRQLDHRTHRKILVIDGEVGFTGGVGIADEWRGNAESPRHWRDNHYRIRGPVVGQLQAAFCDNWMQTTGRVLQGDEYFPRAAVVGGTVAQMFRSSSGGGSENMELLFLLSVAAAGKNIQIGRASCRERV